MKPAFYCATSLLLAGASLARAQSQPASAPVDSAAYQPYVRALQAESRLLSGTDYVSTVRPDAEGHPFFEKPIAQPASILYDGQQFGQVPLLYDIQRDQVVVQLPDSNLRLQLLAEKVQRFSLAGHHFVRRTAADSVASAGLPTGFYDVLVPGAGPQAALLARYTKRQEQESAAGRLVFVLREKQYCYLQQGSTCTEVSSLRDLQRLLPAHQSELQQYARQQHLKFRNSSQQAAAAQLVAYYNTLLTK